MRLVSFKLQRAKSAKGASYWLVGAPICVLLAVGLGLRGLGVWIGLSIGLLTAATSLCSRFHLLTRRRV